MREVFGGWDVTSDDTPWDSFTHNKGQSPDYEYYDCGNIHYPPNGEADYDWANTNIVESNCDDWNNYPAFAGETAQINCQAWGCNSRGYINWWLTHLPHSEGETDGVENNWWVYLG